MKIHFTKMSGAGNDFVVVDNRSNIIQDRLKFAQQVCNRRLGIGADGLLLVENSSLADFTMRYFNADGSDGGMCGNGGRCIAQFSFLTKVVSTNKFKFDCLDYIYNAFVESDGSVKLNMKNPLGIRFNEVIAVNGIDLNTHFINTGSPHCIIFLDENPTLAIDLESVEVVKFGREIRYKLDLYPKGTNVNFVAVAAANSIAVRTYERGVEDETLACGTGSIGSAIMSSLVQKTNQPINVFVKSGEILEVGFSKNPSDEITNVILKGSAKVTFKGEFELD